MSEMVPGIMTKKIVFSLAVLGGASVCLSASEAASAVKISPQTIVDRVLTTSDRVEAIRLENQKAYIGMERLLGKYDFNLSMKIDYTYNEAENFSGLANPIDKTYAATAGVSKLSRTGTLLSVDYRHSEQASVLNPIVANSRSPNLALDEVGLNLRQNLWQNALGMADRLNFAIEKQAVSDAERTRQENLEDLALEAMKLYWDTYVAQVQLRDAVAARERYTKLVESVRRRSGLGLERGGELTQVTAEFEDANQSAKRAATAYLTGVDKLSTLARLELPAKEDLEFAPGEPLPAVPQPRSVELENLRKFAVEKNSVENQRMKLRSAGLLAAPQLDLIASAKSTGVETNFNRSYAEMTSGTKPTYYVGVEFKTALDSSAVRAELTDAQVKLALEENKLRAMRDDLRLKGEELERKVQAAFEIARSAIESADLRERTVRAQESEYRGGRLLLIELMRTYNSFFDAQARRARAVGDYHIALNELAAFRDELVK